jgi:hypothetical protein
MLLKISLRRDRVKLMWKVNWAGQQILFYFEEDYRLIFGIFELKCHHMIKHLPVIVLFLLFLTTADAQTKGDSARSHPRADTGAKHSPHKNVKHSPGPLVIPHSPVKTLSDVKYNILLKGADFDDMALAAVLNHYPLPDSALKYKVQLGLNPGQITKLKDISSTLHRKRLEMGDNIIRNEKMLDTLFKIKQADDGAIIFYTNRYGLYLGEIRNAVLQACYKTENILSDVQIRKLESLEK